MGKKLPTFEDLKKNYPTDKDSEAVKKSIGGNVDKSWYVNTCIIRVSKSLNYAKHVIPADSGTFKTRKGGDKLWYGLGVQQFWEWMEKTYGKPDVYAEPDPKTLLIPFDKFAGKMGIIGFRVKWDDASGHFSLFDGKDLLFGGDKHDYWSISWKAALWLAT